MTGPEHFLQSEAWLYKAKHSDARGGAETDISCAAIAQVHATLGLAAATAFNRTDGRTVEPDGPTWFDVAGIKPDKDGAP